MILKLRICATSMRDPVCDGLPSHVLRQALPQEKYTSPLRSSVLRSSVDNLTCEKVRRYGRYKLSVRQIIACRGVMSNCWLFSTAMPGQRSDPALLERPGTTSGRWWLLGVSFEDLRWKCNALIDVCQAQGTGNRVKRETASQAA